MNSVSNELRTKSQVLRMLDVVAQPGAYSEKRLVVFRPAANMIVSSCVGAIVGETKQCA